MVVQVSQTSQANDGILPAVLGNNSAADAQARLRAAASTVCCCPGAEFYFARHFLQEILSPELFALKSQSAIRGHEGAMHAFVDTR